MIEIQSLRKSYGELEILKGIDLTIKEAELVSIVGASGAGKTTLLQLIGALDRFNEGDILVSGKSLKGLSKNQLSHYRNKDVGFIFQFHNLLPEFTAVENVGIPALIAGDDWTEVQHRASKLLKMLGLEHRLEHKPNSLSGGEQQRVAVARALINQPKVLLADEPSGNLDTENANQLHQLFLDIRSEFNLTCLIVTHNPQLADLADRKLQMKDGQLV